MTIAYDEPIVVEDLLREHNPDGTHSGVSNLRTVSEQDVGTIGPVPGAFVSTERRILFTKHGGTDFSSILHVESRHSGLVQTITYDIQHDYGSSLSSFDVDTTIQFDRAYVNEPFVMVDIQIPTDADVTLENKRYDVTVTGVHIKFHTTGTGSTTLRVRILAIGY